MATLLMRISCCEVISCQTMRVTARWWQLAPSLNQVLAEWRQRLVTPDIDWIKRCLTLVCTSIQTRHAWNQDLRRWMVKVLLFRGSRHSSISIVLLNRPRLWTILTFKGQILPNRAVSTRIGRREHEVRLVTRLIIVDRGLDWDNIGAWLLLHVELVMLERGMTRRRK